MRRCSRHSLGNSRRPKLLIRHGWRGSRIARGRLLKMLIWIGGLKVLPSWLAGEILVWHLLRCLRSRKIGVRLAWYRGSAHIVAAGMRSLRGDDGVDLIGRVREGWRRAAGIAILHALGILKGIDVEVGRIEDGVHGRVEVGVRVRRIRIEAIAILRRPRVHVVQLRAAHLKSRIVSAAMTRALKRCTVKKNQRGCICGWFGDGEEMTVLSCGANRPRRSTTREVKATLGQPPQRVSGTCNRVQKRLT